MAPLRSLTSLGFAADWSATGTGTDLRGRMLVHPGGRVVLDKVAGAADGTLLQALQPDLPFTCTLPMQLAFDRIAVHEHAEMIDLEAFRRHRAVVPTIAWL